MTRLRMASFGLIFFLVALPVAEAQTAADAQKNINQYRETLRTGIKEPEISRIRRALSDEYVRLAVDRIRPGSFQDLDNATILARAGLFYARLGDAAQSTVMFARALEVAASAEARATYQDDKVAYANVAWRLATAGRVKEAVDTAHKIKSPFRRVEALTLIATTLARSGVASEARALIGQALNQVLADQSTALRVSGLRLISEALWHMNDKEGARKVLQVMREAIKANTGAETTTREMIASFKVEGIAAGDRTSYAYMEYAIALLLMGNQSEFLSAATQVQDDLLRLELAKRLAEAGYPEEAEAALRRAHSKNKYFVEKSGSALALAYAKTGRFADAWRIYPEMKGGKLFLHEDIAKMQAASGDLNGAAEALEKHVGGNQYYFKTVKGPLARATALAHQGDIDSALSLIKESSDADYNLALAYATMNIKEE